MATISKMKLAFEDKGSKTINNVNPEAEDADVKATADLLIGLQTREVATVSRIDERVLQ